MDKRGVVKKDQCALLARLRKKPWLLKILLAIGAPLWVVASYYLSQLIIVGVLKVLSYVGIELIVLVRETVLQSILSAVAYGLTLTLTVGVPLLVCKFRVSREDVGFGESFPSWRDALLSPVVFIAATFSTFVAFSIIGQLVSGFDIGARQEVGFDSQLITQRYELVLAYLTLVVIGPVVEELLFRGYLHGVLRRKLPAWLTVLLVSLVFGALHLGIGLTDKLQWNVAIDTFVLSLWLGFLRHYTGTVWLSIFVHIIKNSLAFFLMFVVPVVSVSAGM